MSVMKLRILEHYHGQLVAEGRHLQAGEEYDIPGKELTLEAANVLVSRGKAAWVTRAGKAMEQMIEAKEEPATRPEEVAVFVADPEAQFAQKPARRKGKKQVFPENI